MARWWVCGSREAFTALTVDCEVLWWEPSVWPNPLWPRGRKIWAAANSLAVLARRYLHSSRKFFVGYDVVSIQAELLGLVDVADTVPKETIEPALDNLEARLAIAKADFQLGAETRAKFDYLLGMGLALLFVAPASLIVLLNWAAPSRDVVVLNAAASGIAGAFGALVSVLLRLANTGLGLDYRAGATMAVVLGFGRLVLGSIFAAPDLVSSSRLGLRQGSASATRRSCYLSSSAERTTFPQEPARPGCRPVRTSLKNRETNDAFEHLAARAGFDHPCSSPGARTRPSPC